MKRCLMGAGTFAIGAYSISDLFSDGKSGLKVGFRNDAPKELWKWSKEALWYEKTNSGFINCKLCPHECMLLNNDRGQCRVRVAKDDKLYTLVYGNPCAVHIDPIEKKPLYHFLPGTGIFSLATAGCNLRCLNCQNWEISQRKPEETDNTELFPEKAVELTFHSNLPSIAYTYSEPIIFYEYVLKTSQLAREKNICNVLVTAGYIGCAPLKELCKVIDAVNVDIKTFNDNSYKKFCGARLKPILDAIVIMKEAGLWIEITRLIVPTLTDDMDDIQKMCRWIKEYLGPETPLHISRFYGAYKLIFFPPTSEEKLYTAAKIAKEEGLEHVYVGNVPESKYKNTFCPKCKKMLIERIGYKIISNKIKNGKCDCGYPIAGVWNT